MRGFEGTLKYRIANSVREFDGCLYLRESARDQGSQGKRQDSGVQDRVDQFEGGLVCHWVLLKCIPEDSLTYLDFATAPAAASIRLIPNYESTLSFRTV